MFNLSKGTYFSMGHRMFRVDGLNMNQGNVVSVDFYELTRPKEIINRSMSVMMDLMIDNKIKYEGLIEPKKR